MIFIRTLGVCSALAFSTSVMAADESVAETSESAFFLEEVPAQLASPVQKEARPAVVMVSRPVVMALPEAEPEEAIFDNNLNAPAAKPQKAISSGTDSRTVACLASAVFHEARGEPVKGQKAVADVVVNRARSGKWGDICGVVDAPHQFSGRNKWRKPSPGSAAWDNAFVIAREAIERGAAVSKRIMNFRHVRMGAPVKSAIKIGRHLFW